MAAVSCVRITSGDAIRSDFLPPFLGTLQTAPEHAGDLSGHGVKVAMLELAWSRYETAPGDWDVDYERRMVEQFRTLRAAGMQVTLGLGLHYTPGWVRDLPDSRFVDQDGRRSDQVDFTFDRDVRAAADRYLQRVAQAFPAGDFFAVRITSGGRGELLFPAGDSYWAFGPDALDADRVATAVGANPLPDWRPGDDGEDATAVRQWYDWYVGALAETATWQIDLLRSLGFRGYFEILTPGVGVQPEALDRAVAAHLPPGLAGQGVAWLDVYQRLPHDPDIVASVTSTGDGSGGDVGCAPEDRQVPVTSTAVKSWSAARWISRVADEFGLAKVGENPGYTAGSTFRAHYTDRSAGGLMATSLSLARSCGYLGFYWAHDAQLWDGTVDAAEFYGYTSPDAGAPPTALQD
ncbi:hypothetical protein [Nakamurella endophytica]|uniref:hypothetical protein n=1 Tax=Nakamurella endophytica TaxID=1748367 RepID=UPI00166E4D8A|nr:hypothetical protein [Nakamurella endophytica]